MRGARGIMLPYGLIEVTRAPRNFYVEAAARRRGRPQHAHRGPRRVLRVPLVLVEEGRAGRGGVLVAGGDRRGRGSVEEALVDGHWHAAHTVGGRRAQERLLRRRHPALLAKGDRGHVIQGGHDVQRQRRRPAECDALPPRRRASPVAPGHRAVLDLKQQNRHLSAGVAA